MACDVSPVAMFFPEGVPNFFLISLRDNSSDPLSGDPDAVEWEKGFIEYAIENVSSHIVKSNQSHPDHKVSYLFHSHLKGSLKELRFLDWRKEAMMMRSILW